MSLLDYLPETTKRIRDHTDPKVNEAIRLQTEVRIRALQDASEQVLNDRIEQLHNEWDIDRCAQTVFSAAALAGVGLGTRKHEGYLVISALSSMLLIGFATTGWCPPMSALRRLGLRTRREIERERYALKHLRGDFERASRMREARTSDRVLAAIEAVDA